MASAVVTIYDLSDPRTGEVRYIGKSVNPRERLATHIREARDGNVLHCRRWIDGLLKEGLRPSLSVLEETDVFSADDAERFWIASFKLMGARLTNRTFGGDGQAPGYVPLPHVIEKARVLRTGSKLSEETKRRMRETLATPEARERKRRAIARLLQDPEWLAKVRHGRTGRKNRKETNDKIASSWTPERKAAHVAEKSALPFDDRWRAQLAAALKTRWDKYRAAKC